ncbi:predicted protein [Sclerotinia sclerotiorum 1980 UF-70]|uniref:Uncharacterized protein n=1 Tax=Sclerotinia sclerotiorum (strain ATCC 18683 / 1980 / Ss-1) TaxID=665079 RepID=A7E930_SCLS1|nr:predicted protein [Sclerotinia sclerotiorum 1980 UF-70]EDN96882.1 predicted protein [Sclerotinia sclerotiorum 1980 UF-70]
MSPPLLGAIVISLPFLLSSSPLKYSRFLMGNLHRQHLRNTWKPNQSKECPSFGVLYNARNPALVFHANAVLLLFHLAVIPHTDSSGENVPPEPIIRIYQKLLEPYSMVMPTNGTAMHIFELQGPHSSLSYQPKAIRETQNLISNQNPQFDEH